MGQLQARSSLSQVLARLQDLLLRDSETGRVLNLEAPLAGLQVLLASDLAHLGLSFTVCQMGIPAMPVLSSLGRWLNLSEPWLSNAPCIYTHRHLV